MSDLDARTREWYFEAEITMLNMRVSELEAALHKQSDMNGRLITENSELRAENEKLRKALKPFAEVLTLRDCGAVVFEDIEIDHVYAARKALGE